MTANTRRVRRPQGPPERGGESEASPPRKKRPDSDLEHPYEPSIPDIGNGRRWYDLPYKSIRALQRTKISLRLPARWQAWIRIASNFLYQTHHADERRQSARTYRFDNAEIPSGEGVQVPNAWVVEYFTASNVGLLYKAMRRSGWDGPRFIGSINDGTTSLTSSRRGGGNTWWRMVHLTSKKHNGTYLESHRAKLPRGVSSVELIGVSIGSGVTAVVAQFSLDDSISEELNLQLRKAHTWEVLRRKGQIAVAQSPKAVLHHHTQRARTRVHNELRQWMVETLPGAFAAAKQPHPLFDLVFFDVADPLVIDSDGRSSENDALRGIGVDQLPVSTQTSPELPGLVLDQGRHRAWDPDLTGNVWTLWGNKSAIDGLARGTGWSGPEAAGSQVGSRTTDFMARSGLTALLRAMRREATVARDNARRLHGGMSGRDVKRLRNRLLTFSLDMTTIEADVKEYNSRRWMDREPQFFLDSPAWLKRDDKRTGHKTWPAIDMNKRIRKEQKRLARELVLFDAQYREVLSTVSSLGASLDSRRVQRLAIGISVVSLVVALVTLWVTQQSPLDFSTLQVDDWNTGHQKTE